MTILNNKVKEVLVWMLYILVGIIPFFGFMIFLTFLPNPFVEPILLTLVTPLLALVILITLTFITKDRARKLFATAASSWYILVTLYTIVMFIISYFSGNTYG